jgi:trans-aconitate methyltransferase
VEVIVRNHDLEFQDNAGRKYAYEFDDVIRRYLMRTFEPWFVHGESLELGCYKGDMTRLILERFPHVTVVEGASELSRIVQERFEGRVTAINADFADVELERRYANVFLVHTLEHVDDPVAILSRIRSWLVPGGRLFVAVPNANALSRQIAVKMGLIEHHAAVTPAERAHGHRRTYALDVLLADLRRANLSIDDFGGVLVKPLSNAQFDQAIAQGIVSEAYLEACHALARMYPDLGASVYAVCRSANEA